MVLAMSVLHLLLMSQKHMATWMVSCLLVHACAGEYVAVEAVETALKGGAANLVSGLWVYGDPLQRRLVAVAVPHRAE
jgi:hypothetical protein